MCVDLQSLAPVFHLQTRAETPVTLVDPAMASHRETTISLPTTRSHPDPSDLRSHLARPKTPAVIQHMQSLPTSSRAHLANACVHWQWARYPTASQPTSIQIHPTDTCPPPGCRSLRDRRGDPCHPAPRCRVLAPPVVASEPCCRAPVAG